MHFIFMRKDRLTKHNSFFTAEVAAVNLAINHIIKDKLIKKIILKNKNVWKQPSI